MKTLPRKICIIYILYSFFNFNFNFLFLFLCSEYHNSPMGCLYNLSIGVRKTGLMLGSTTAVFQREVAGSNPTWFANTSARRNFISLQGSFSPRVSACSCAIATQTRNLTDFQHTLSVEVFLGQCTVKQAVVIEIRRSLGIYFLKSEKHSSILLFATTQTTSMSDPNITRVQEPPI